MIELLKKLMLTSGVSGREDKIREVIKEEITPYCDEIISDAMGNLIAHKRGNGKKIMFGAHMDEIGYFATHITEKGFIGVSAIGGISFLSASYFPVVSEKGVVGVLAPKKTTEIPKAEDVLVDIGAKNKRQAESRVKIGDFFVHTPSIKHLVGTRYMGRPFDNRVGCAVLIEALKRAKSENDLYFVFTVQEEVGCRGARPATYTVEPDIAINLDVTRADDRSGGDRLGVSLGEGATIKIRDGSVICNHETVLKMREIAKENGIKYQDETLSKGGTDTSAMQITRRGCMAGAISIPCGFIHTPCEVIDINDAKEAVKLAVAIAERM